MRTKAIIEGVEDLNPGKFGGMASRALSLKAQKDISSGITTIATTEEPAEVIDWGMWCVVREILPMKYMEMPDNNKVPLLDSHDRSEIENVKGSARDFTVDGSNLMCLTYISSTEPDLITKIQEQHVDSVSIGYETDQEYTVQIPKNAKVIIDGVVYSDDSVDDTPLVVRTWWKVRELSVVAIGADSAAKFKSKRTDDTKMLEKINELQKEIEELKTNKKETPNSLSYHEAQVRLMSHV